MEGNLFIDENARNYNAESGKSVCICRYYDININEFWMHGRS